MSSPEVDQAAKEDAFNRIAHIVDQVELTTIIDTLETTPEHEALFKQLRGAALRNHIGNGKSPDDFKMPRIKSCIGRFATDLLAGVTLMHDTNDLYTAYYASIELADQHPPMHHAFHLMKPATGDETQISFTDVGKLQEAQQQRRGRARTGSQDPAFDVIINDGINLSDALRFTALELAARPDLFVASEAEQRIMADNTITPERLTFLLSHIAAVPSARVLPTNSTLL